MHVGGTFDQVADSESRAWDGVDCSKPFVLVAQQSLFDDTRAPRGQHTGWAYCHVPHGSKIDMLHPLELQIERFAPGFRGTILERHVMNAEGMDWGENFVSASDGTDMTMTALNENHSVRIRAGADITKLA